MNMEEYKEKTIDLRDYFRIFLKRRWVIITVFMVVVLFAAIKTFTATPYLPGHRTNRDREGEPQPGIH